jgi:DNA-binding GntR family transcriptional regulator
MSRSSPQQGQQLLSELRRRIVLNELAPGSVLTELGIAAELGRSQSAVREALLRLEGEGLVRRAGRQGTTVTDLDADTASEILDLRRRIELRGARRAVKRAVAGDVAGLRALLEAMHRSAAAGDVWGVVEQDIAFHLALFRIAGLDALEPILERCILHTHRFKLWAPWHQRPLAETAARHAPLIDALAEGDAARLARDLGEHIDTIVERRSAA